MKFIVLAIKNDKAKAQTEKMKLPYFETFTETKHGKINPAEEKIWCFGKKRKKRKNEDKEKKGRENWKGYK